MVLLYERIIKFRKKEELIDAIRETYARIQVLGNQEKEEFNNWVRHILLSICGNRELVMKEILNRTGNGADDMAFTYNIIKAVEEEKAEARRGGREEGLAEGREEGLAEGKAEGFNEKGMQVFLNALKHGMSRADAKMIAEIDDSLIEIALKRMEEK